MTAVEAAAAVATTTTIAIIIEQASESKKLPPRTGFLSQYIPTQFQTQARSHTCTYVHLCKQKKHKREPMELNAKKRGIVCA